MGIITFKDDKRLEKGDVIANEIVKAIQESMFAIGVLSPNYATSAWCLDELQEIVECSKNLVFSVVPIFYGVDPSDARFQKGIFAQAFTKHEERFGHDSEKIKRWRDALTQVASLSGWDSKNQHEAELVESIAQDIHTKLIPKLPSCTEDLVGIASRVEEVFRLIGMGLKDVRFIGIWGMGGIGKTTIAQEVFEAIRDKFEVSCFLANVREVCETIGLVEIQKQLVAHMNISTRNIHNVYDGKKAILSSVGNKKVLLVLDDVNGRSQLEYLAGKKEWFGQGSRIIITTRDMHLLEIHGVHGSYEAKGLTQNEALKLFCLKVFKRDQPDIRYVGLSEEVVKYSGGLPLSLEVLGSHFVKRTDWSSSIQKMRSDPNVEILNTLKISYDSLDFKEKNIFLDIACFFKGHHRNDVIDILEKCGHNPRIAIDVLIERSLVTLSGGCVLKMHDLVEEMGRNIVLQESPNDPSKRSRLWSIEDVGRVLTKHVGNANIESIVVGGYDTARWNDEGLSNMSMLRLLKISCPVELPSGLKYLPSSLKVLHWENCPLETIPLAEDEEYDLIEIVMRDTIYIEQLWHGEKVLGKLEHLHLDGCRYLDQIPDLSGTPNLKTVIVVNNRRLTDVHPSLMHHKKLVTLRLSYCDGLETLSGKLEMSSLTDLALINCSIFENLPEFGECMIHLSSLELTGTAIWQLPTSIGYLVGLKYLYLEQCENLVYLRDTINELKSLVVLHVSGCPNLSSWESSVLMLPLLTRLDLTNCGLTKESLPHDLWDLPSLTWLILSGNNYVSIPIRIHELPKLKEIELNDCLKLKFLPELPSSVRSVQAWRSESLDTCKFNIFFKGE